MQKLILYLFALFCFAGAKAQSSLGNQVMKAKFELVKTTVEFLASDVETFGKNTAAKCTECMDYKTVKQFARDNKLLKVDVLVGEWEKAPVDSTEPKWQKSLANFKNQVITKITSGEREKRKKLQTFDPYLQSLDNIIKSVQTTNGANANLPEPANTTVQQQQPEDTSSFLLNKTNVLEKTSSKISSILTWIPLGTAALLLGLLLYTMQQKNKIQQRKEYYKEKAKQLKLETGQNKQTISALILKNKELEQKLNDSELDRKALEDRLISAEKSKLKPPPQQKAEEQVSTEKLTKKPVVQQVKAPAAILKFARYADLGDGFSNAELLDHPDTETIFELSITSNNTGEFKITKNPDAQRYALSNAQYFLGKTCQYDSFPLENAGIQTDTPGNVKLNSGKWTIINPAKITFI